MRKIVYAGSRYGEWAPNEQELLLPWAPYYKERAPVIFAHELGHAELGHDWGVGDIHGVIEERDAWSWALSKLPAEEVDLEFIEYVWDENIEHLETITEDQRTIDFAKKSKNEIMALARRKKNAL